MKKALIAILPFVLAACGGGDDPNNPQVAGPWGRNATAGGQIVPLRACETTGPDAPPCSAKQQAGGVQAQ